MAVRGTIGPGSMLMTHEFRLYGHRGCSAHLPENTIESFRRALDDGANALELDIHRTRDRHYVVSHDPNGMRTAGKAERIRSCSLAEVLRWDVGTGFVDSHGERPYVGRGFRIPLLEEVLERFPDVPLSIDLKARDVSEVEPALDLVAACGAEGRVTLASFHHRVLTAVHRSGFSGRIALGRREVAALRVLPLPAARLLVRGHAAQIPVVSGFFRLDTPRFVRRCRRLGIRLDYWVINRPEQAAALIELGATGVMSDDPGLILAGSGLQTRTAGSA